MWVGGALSVSRGPLPPTPEVPRPHVLPTTPYTQTQVAVDDLWLSVSRGQVVALLGHNGAGKSTAIAALTGLLEPTSGEALVCGRSVARSGHSRASIGVCPQVGEQGGGCQGGGGGTHTHVCVCVGGGARRLATPPPPSLCSRERPRLPPPPPPRLNSHRPLLMLPSLTSCGPASQSRSTWSWRPPSAAFPGAPTRCRMRCMIQAPFRRALAPQPSLPDALPRPTHPPTHPLTHPPSYPLRTAALSAARWRTRPHQRWGSPPSWARRRGRCRGGSAASSPWRWLC